MMKVQIEYGEHQAVKNHAGEALEFEFKAINGKMIKAFHLCAWCKTLIEIAHFRHGACIDAHVSTEQELMARRMNAQDRLEEDFE